MQKVLVLLLLQLFIFVATGQDKEELSDKKKQGVTPGTKIKAKEWNKPKELFSPGTKKNDKFSIYGVVAKENAIFKFDPETGESEIIGPLGFNVGNSALSFHPDGTLWGFSDNMGGVPLDREERRRKFKERMEYIKKLRGQGKAIDREEIQKKFGFGFRRRMYQRKLYTVDLKTGKGTIVKEFNQQIGGGIGLEWDKEGKNLYWICTKVYRLDIEKGEIETVMDLPKGKYSLSLGRTPSGKLIGITVKDHELFELDLKKKEQTIIRKLKFTGKPPALAITPNNRVFFSTVDNKIYYMKNLNAGLELLGKPGVSPWGLAIKPRFHMKDDKHHSKSEKRRCKERPQS